MNQVVQARQSTTDNNNHLTKFPEAYSYMTEQGAMCHYLVLLGFHLTLNHIRMNIM